MSSRQLKKITGYDETEALRNDILKIFLHPEISGILEASIEVPRWAHFKSKFNSDIFVTSKKVSQCGYFVSTW